jgi:hypothetical protein
MIGNKILRLARDECNGKVNQFKITRIIQAIINTWRNLKVNVVFLH